MSQLKAVRPFSRLTLIIALPRELYYVGARKAFAICDLGDYIDTKKTFIICDFGDNVLGQT